MHNRYMRFLAWDFQRRIRLRRGERRRLERLVNKRTTPQRVVERANIVLCSAEGRSGSAICREVGVSVTQWLDRYEAGGDRGPTTLRPRKITPDDEAEIVRKEEKQTPRTAVSWPRVGVHPTTISPGGHGLQPHRIEYFKLSDPHFVEKLRESLRSPGAGRCLRFREEPDPARPHPARSSPQEGARWNHDP